MLGKLAEDFAAAENSGRAELLSQNDGIDAVGLARSLKDLCVDAWGGDTERVFRAAEAVSYLSELNCSEEIRAYADWSGGYASLVRGQMKQALGMLDSAIRGFTSLNQPHTAASAQILKLYPLASLNRFDEAIATGIETRKTLLDNLDLTGVGKVELNLGNLYWLRDRFSDAESFYRSARTRFQVASDTKLLTQAENSLAVVLTAQNQFREAEDIYRNALPRAEIAGLDVTVAEIESSLGMLALSQGHYDRALDFLERARRRYSELKMPLRLATTEKEVADAYLELNLAHEAAEIYERIEHSFADLGTPFEQAQALANHAKALLMIGNTRDSRKKRGAAARLYEECESEGGTASVEMIEAQLEFADGNFMRSADKARAATVRFAKIGVVGQCLNGGFLEAEALRSEGDLEGSAKRAEATLADAVKSRMPQIEWRLHTTLGLIYAESGQVDFAENAFRVAISIVESLRAPLPAEEFRASFLIDKVEPYAELARLCLIDTRYNRVAEAMTHLESSRARTLVEMMGSKIAIRESREPSAFESEAMAKLEKLREELNWYYSRINRLANINGASPEHVAELERELQKREVETSELMRQIAARCGGTTGEGASKFEVAGFQKTLSKDTVFVEFASLRGRIGAFVVTDSDVQFVAGLGSEDAVAELLVKLRFQINALKHGHAEIRRHLYDLTLRTRHYLSELYDTLFRPIEELIGLRRLVIAPHMILHYVPFPALFDGVSYLIENREIVLAPSAAAWQAAVEKLPGALRKALLLAVPDDQIANVTDEVRAIETLFPETITLEGANASLTALRRHSSEANILHLACHGRFRAENPLFSSLTLGDGVLNVRDAATLDLKNCEITVLSACETGVNRVAPGDELLGLTRGFLAAGVPTLVLSKWAVDDQATAFLMKQFYRRLIGGSSPATAMRVAQCETMKSFPHPFFWASFSVTGRP